MFDSYFKLSEHGSNLRTELIAGVTTFLAMAYIIFVNPEILSASGMDRNSVFVATCLVSAIGSLIMGLYANYPITVAPGMGLNAYFSYTVVGTLGYSWQVALGAVFISGLLFLIISVLPVREWIVNSIPRSQKMAISAGIGFLLGIVALESAGIIVAHPVTLVTVGDLTKPITMLAVSGSWSSWLWITGGCRAPSSSAYCWSRDWAWSSVSPNPAASSRHRRALRLPWASLTLQAPSSWAL